jgi:hypothetical protein
MSRLLRNGWVSLAARFTYSWAPAPFVGWTLAGECSCPPQPWRPLPKVGKAKAVGRAAERQVEAGTMPSLVLLAGDRCGPARPRTRTRTSAGQLGLASDRLRRLEQHLRQARLPAEAMAVRHISDLLDGVAGDVSARNVGTA